MRSSRPVLAGLLAVTALGTAAVPAAHAARNPYTPGQICGSGFRVIDSHGIATPTRRLGRTFLLYNARTGRNCVTTIKTAAVGRAAGSVSASIQKQGGAQRMDSGNFRYYAGPKKVKARGTCVRWGGGITVGSQSAGFDTAYEHCG